MHIPIAVLSFFGIFVHSIDAGACATSIKGAKNSPVWKEYFAEHVKVEKILRKPADVGRLPYADLEPWGGGDRSNWKPEAIMANAASRALNEGFAEPNVRDVWVAMPVKMRYSGNEKRVYGDGQTNAAVDLGDTWTEREPTLIATRIVYNDGSQKLKFRMHKKIALKEKDLKISVNGVIRKLPLSSTSADGHFDYEWKPSGAEAPQWGDLFTNRVAFVQPDGWRDWFPIDFRDVFKRADELLAQIPAEKRILGKGTLLDPEAVSVQGLPGDRFPFQGMASENFGKELKGDRYFPVPSNDVPQGIHNTFPGGRVTSVGRGFTTVFEAPPASPAPFKLAYICFDRRNRDAEAVYGVPSGAGWHEIGDEAETVFNSLENAPVVFGYANGWPAKTTPSGDFSYGLTDVAVIRKLNPGYAIVTAAGATTYSEDTVDGKCRNAPSRGKSGPENRNYHWFIFDHPHEVCAVEWVHPNVPSPTNKLGLEPLARLGCR